MLLETGQFHFFYWGKKVLKFSLFHKIKFFKVGIRRSLEVTIDAVSHFMSNNQISNCKITLDSST